MFTTLLSGDFYPRPPRGGRPAGHCGPRRTIIISIHALREEGDHVQSFAGEGIEGFLSTPSARRATGIGYVIQRPSIISIHALREEGDLRLLYIQLSFWISIHALRRAIISILFLSTPSARRATICSFQSQPCSAISIHALREEGDGVEC